MYLRDLENRHCHGLGVATIPNRFGPSSEEEDEDESYTRKRGTYILCSRIIRVRKEEKREMAGT
jgi:hypothetical protein